jgi:DNA-binding beta-propeller fold protein YncE
MKFTLLLLAVSAFAQQIPVDTFPMAQAITPDGKLLLVLNAGINPPSVSVIDIANAKELSRAAVPDGWLGLIINKAGDRVYVGGGSKAAVYEFKFANGTLTPSRLFPIVADKDRKPEDFVGDIRFAPDEHLLYATNLFRDYIAVINPQSGLVISRFKTGRRPYKILFHKLGKSLYVSSWADGSIDQYDATSGQQLGVTRVGPHPTDMIWRDGEVEGQPGIHSRIFVSASNTNSVFSLGVTESGELTRLETINLTLTPRQPIGTTPEGLGLSSDGKQLYVACADINAVAVIDLGGERTRVLGYIPAGLYPSAALGLPGGQISIINSRGNTVQLSGAVDEEKLVALTEQVHSNSPYRDTLPETSAGSIKHVVYVIAATAPDVVSRALAGLSTDFVTKLNNGRTPLTEEDPAATPPAGYLWTNAAQAGISMRSYGFFTTNRKTAEADGTQVDAVHDSVLAKVTDMQYRGPDAAYADSDRVKEFISELHEYEQTGQLAQLLLVRLTDAAAIAQLSDAIAKSRFAKETRVITVTPTSNATEALHSVEQILNMRPLTIFDAQ